MFRDVGHTRGRGQSGDGAEASMDAMPTCRPGSRTDRPSGRTAPTRPVRQAALLNPRDPATFGLCVPTEPHITATPDLSPQVGGRSMSGSRLAVTRH